MKHLKRAGLVLAALLVLVFVLPRLVPVTEKTAAYGFHDVDEESSRLVWAAKPMQYANTTACNSCHQPKYVSWSQADHRSVSCETCHFPAIGHLEGKALPVVDRSRDSCGNCHAALISRPPDFPQVDISKHGGQETCVTCHNPHDPREGMPPRPPHSLEGRENCQSCHNPAEPLARVPPRVPHTLEGREDCASCHEQANVEPEELPRIPHPLEGRDDCLLCHNASSITPFPENHTGRTADTCQSCHQREL